MGVKYVKDFEFPRSAGFTGSADGMEGRVHVGHHTRQQPRQRFAEGGKVEKPKEEPKVPPKVEKPPPPKKEEKLSTLDLLRGKGRRLQEERLGLNKGGRARRYAEGGAVRDTLGHSAVQRSLPTTQADADNGGKGELRPGFNTGGIAKRERFATGGTTGKNRYAEGGQALVKKVAAQAIKKHVAAPKPRGHGVKRSTGGPVNY